MRRICAIISGFLLLLPLVSAQGVQTAPSGASKGPEPPKSEAKQLGEQMLSELREIMKLLSGVTDRASADEAAVPLREKLKSLDAHLRRLETLPLTNEQDARSIHGDMTELMHLSQAGLDMLQRLREVSAYGSEALMAIFDQYKFGLGAAPALRADDLPHSQLYNQLADEIEDALYTLRKVQDEAGAHDAAITVENLLDQIEHTHQMLTQLAPPRTQEQREALEPARTRLLHVTAEARKVHESFRQKQFFGDPQLSEVMNRLIRTTVL